MGQGDSVTAALGRRIAEPSPLDAEVARHAMRALVDWFGATLAGWREAPAIALRAALSDEVGRGDCLLYDAGGPAASPRNAALLNGTASHVVEMDDIYSPALYHPGCPTIAAALAVGQARGVSGAALLRAIAVGYEVGDRLGAALQPGHYRFWHTTGTIGALGAAAAAAAILDLDADRAAHALAAASTFAAGLQQAFRVDSMLKPLHAGRAAEAGVLAALSAEAGLTAPAEMIEGPVGLAAAMGGGSPDWEAMFRDWNRPPTIGQVTVKVHACCGHAFAAIDGALALRASVGALSDVAAIEVETYTTAAEVAGIARPASPFEARFSIAFGVACALSHGAVRLDAFTPQRLAEPAIQALTPKVVVRGTSEFDRVFPARRGARVTITLAKGERLVHLQETRRGEPDHPVDDAELDAKFIELAAPALGVAAPAILARIRSAAEQSNLGFTRFWPAGASARDATWISS